MFKDRESQPLLPGPPGSSSSYVLVIHGGAGTMTREGSTPEQRAAYHRVLKQALRAGYAVLSEGREAMDAVVAAVTVMEDCPLFNAGKGAVFNVAGKNELEASLALSKPPESHPRIKPSRRGSSITLLTRIRNPAKLARLLYLAQDDGVPHPMLSGAAAEQAGAKFGADLVDPEYFFTKRRWVEHRRGLGLPEEPVPLPDDTDVPMLDLMPKGTVGAVALDIRGCIAACTSTGGRTNKLVGRIGDTPIMGCGFWAEEWTPKGKLRRLWRKVTRKNAKVAVGVSGTGDGDYFIRQNTASTVARRMQYLGEPLHKSAQWVVDDLRVAGGDGGVIAIDDAGNVSMTLNCPGMYRGVIYEDGVPKTAIFADDELRE
ncbi:asparaginase [Vararia minispora EC-137]|uniref:Asparaginase n=1 Tax=Vararia minispora EC-137 TaxID=1314806 RepID=A0ACB8QYL9_9AGAM|nr:asparaginase [Vararia minispora EC-137]